MRGTLDGSPLDKQFPRPGNVENISSSEMADGIGKDAYSTEGWNVTNRGWLSTLTFSTLGSHHVKIFDASYKNEITTAKPGQKVILELKAALNQNWDKVDKGWVDISKGAKPEKAEVTETGPNTGIFTTEYVVPKTSQGSKLSVSYGYLGFEKKAELTIAR